MIILEKTEKFITELCQVIKRPTYCPLIWSFCSREGNNMINKSHKLVLNIIHSNLQRNRKQSLDELMSIENCTKISNS